MQAASSCALHLLSNLLSLMEKRGILTPEESRLTLANATAALRADGAGVDAEMLEKAIRPSLENECRH
jgi:hypothetical protein